MSLFDHLSLEEQQAMIARSSSGEHPIFSGETASGVQIDTRRHTIHSGQFFEVEPEQLIDVAKHMTQNGDSAEKIIEKAYALICEAHLTSRNIKHWNEKTRRGHVSERIHRAVEKHEITKGNDKGKVPRLAVIQALLSQRGVSSDKTNAGKAFSSWIKESLRHRSFENEIPWNHYHQEHTEKLYKQLLDKGWVKWFNIGSAGYLVIPEASEPPNHKPKRKLKLGEHPTRPWWGTKNVWWPAATKGEIKVFKARYLTDNSKNFISAHTAKTALVKFDRWLNIIDAVKKETSCKAPKSKVKQDPNTGKFK